MPKGGNLLAQEGVAQLLEELAASNHDGCVRALAGSGYREIGQEDRGGRGVREEVGQDDARSRLKKVAAERQAAMLAQMKAQQAAAAAHMLLECGDGSDAEDEHMSPATAATDSSTAASADQLTRLKGAECALCQEPMPTVGVVWSRFEASSDRWIDYDDTVCQELEEAKRKFELGLCEVLTQCTRFAGTKVPILTQKQIRTHTFHSQAIRCSRTHSEP